MEIKSIQYHRNGSGDHDQFVQVLFSVGNKPWENNLMAIAFDTTDESGEEAVNRDHIAKLAICNLNQIQDKLRPDDYEPLLCKAIAQWDDSFDYDLGKYTQVFPFTV
jgi:hypothetical protein